MSGMNVWLAVGEQGCYSDHKMWIVGVFTTRMAAQRGCEADLHKRAASHYGHTSDDKGLYIESWERGDHQEDSEMLREAHVVEYWRSHVSCNAGTIGAEWHHNLGVNALQEYIMLNCLVQDSYSIGIS